MKRSLSIVAGLGLLACILLTVMMNTYLEPLKTIPKLREEIAARHGEFLGGSTPVVRRLQIDEPDGTQVGYVVELQPSPEAWADEPGRGRHLGAIVITIFESDHRGGPLDFVDLVVKLDAGDLHRRLTLDDARRGRPGKSLTKSPLPSGPESGPESAVE